MITGSRFPASRIKMGHRAIGIAHAGDFYRKRGGKNSKWLVVDDTSTRDDVRNSCSSYVQSLVDSSETSQKIFLTMSLPSGYLSALKRRDFMFRQQEAQKSGFPGRDVVHCIPSPELSAE